MKRIYSFILAASILSFLATNAYSQIKVFDNGYVSVNNLTTTPASRFTVNSTGVSGYQVHIYNPNITTNGAALYTFSEKGSGSGIHVMGHLSSIGVGSNFCYGLKASAYNSTSTTGRAYGVYGIAGNASTGYNYGVYGTLSGANGGAAVFGSITGYGDVSISGQYAGYFRGNVRCENTVSAFSFVTTSDERFKTNIEALSEKESISKLTQLRPVKYNLKQFETTVQVADSSVNRKFVTETPELLTKKKFGLVAQELQKIFPELVFQDPDGNFSVDYNGLIPIMINAINSQEKRILELEAIVNRLLSTQNRIDPELL